jgi:4-hydroxybenzoate polyprenyltransferase
MQNGMSSKTATAIHTARAHLPLCVDLDGTVVLTDTLHEQVLLLIKRNPPALVVALFRLFKGTAAFKREICSRVTLNPESLPYNLPFLAYLRNEAANGRRILLVTAADRTIGNAVAHHLGLFEATLATDGITNLRADAKVTAIERYLGREPFEYAGDSRADLPVWKHSSAAVLVNSPRPFRRIVNDYGVPVTREFPGPRAGFRTILLAARTYQWSKNLLVFAPLALSHQLFDRKKLALCVLAFLALSVSASATYIANDLLDLETDRKHPRKRTRPFAAGTLRIRTGAFLAALLLVCAGVLALYLPLSAQLLLGAYLILSTLYSVFLKKMLFLDVTVLAGLYTLRVFYGGAATATVISPWTLAFSSFLFTSLAICKRLTEMRHTEPHDAGSDIPGRAYSPTDLPAVASLGSASGYVAVLVLALYLNSPDVVALYRHSPVLWLLCPTLAYWVGRMLIIANRGSMHDDPIIFSFRDRASWAVALISVMTVLAAI